MAAMAGASSTPSPFTSARADRSSQPTGTVKGSRRTARPASRSRDSAQETARRFASEPVAPATNPIAQRLEIAFERRRPEQRRNQSIAIGLAIAAGAATTAPTIQRRDQQQPEAGAHES